VTSDLSKPASTAADRPENLRRVAVLGGGITGLTAAWRLHRAGWLPVVFEQSARVGGVIGEAGGSGWLHELGPNSILEGSAEVAAVVEEAGLTGRRLYASETAKRRYIVRGGRPVAMPASPFGFLRSDLFSWRAKFGLLAEPFRRRGRGDVDETVADFVLRRLGKEFLDYAVDPFVAGVYAGDPGGLSVGHGFPKLYRLEQEYGSLILGAIRRRNPSGGPAGRLFSFPNGLQELPVALANGLGEAVRTGHAVQGVRRIEDGWQVDFEAAGGRRSENFSAVVCALPADALAELEFGNVPAGARLSILRDIVHPPVASVFTGYRRSDVLHPLDGFGLLVPRVEQGRILGTLFSSTLFPGRAPDGFVGLTSFVGGMRQPELAASDDPELTASVTAELRRYLGARGTPVFTHVQRWPRAIPQYAPGYQRFKDAIAAAENSAPGLFIGGNCRDGISLANCIESGARLADAVTRSSANAASRRR
jgi:oxygen-dependent protoporphyrinogen oxidase